MITHFFTAWFIPADRYREPSDYRGRYDKKRQKFYVNYDNNRRKAQNAFHGQRDSAYTLEVVDKYIC